MGPRLLGLLLLALALGGCRAGLSRAITLHYPPLTTPASEPRRTPAGPTDDAARPLRIEVEDARPWSRVGEVRGAAGLRNARLEPTEPCASWIRRGLVHELTLTGFAVLEDGAPGAEEARTLSLRVTDCFVTDRFFYDVHLRFQAWVRCRHGKVLIHPIVEQDVQLPLETESGSAEALAVALRAAGLRLADELSHHLSCGQD